MGRVRAREFCSRRRFFAELRVPALLRVLARFRRQDRETPMFCISASGGSVGFEVPQSSAGLDGRISRQPRAPHQASGAAADQPDDAGNAAAIKPHAAFRRHQPRRPDRAERRERAAKRKRRARCRKRCDGSFRKRRASDRSVAGFSIGDASDAAAKRDERSQIRKRGATGKRRASRRFRRDAPTQNHLDCGGKNARCGGRTCAGQPDGRRRFGSDGRQSRFA